MSYLIDLLKKYKEQILYVLFGGLTTVVCLGTKLILDKCFGIVGGLSVIIAEPIAMVFAYVTNKIWVFESKCNSFSELIKEMFSFFSGRIFTIIISWLMSFIFVDKLHFNNMLIQVISAVVVVILNYVISKLIVFKGNE